MERERERGRERERESERRGRERGKEREREKARESEREGGNRRKRICGGSESDDPAAPQLFPQQWEEKQKALTDCG